MKDSFKYQRLNINLQNRILAYDLCYLMEINDMFVTWYKQKV